MRLPEGIKKEEPFIPSATGRKTKKKNQAPQCPHYPLIMEGLKVLLGAGAEKSVRDYARSFSWCGWIRGFSYGGGTRYVPLPMCWWHLLPDLRKLASVEKWRRLLDPQCPSEKRVRAAKAALRKVKEEIFRGHDPYIYPKADEVNCPYFPEVP